MARPDLTELRSTVERMERHLAATPALAEPFSAYQRLVAQFETGLDDPRDVWMSRGGALMLVQALGAAGRG